ncbi:MAG: phenylacetate--CoA ligase [Deltaproteobacteria bacterium]|nr:phenylacetate--CoA ligase [Deltaproteobacteria bacterium]
MGRTFMPEYQRDDELRDVQLAGLQWTVRHVYAGSPFYRDRLDAAGVGPHSIRTLEDIRRLPFTTSADLRDGYPFPFRSVPFRDIVRIHSSSGTTGKRKILAYTKKDVEDWTHFFARCYEMIGMGPEDRIQLPVGYGLWTAGIGFQAGCEALGAMAIPAGPGNLDLQCELLVDLETTLVCCTSSMALLLSEEVHRRGLRDRIRLRSVILGSERSSEALRRRVKELLGVEHIHDLTGMTELYGPGAGVDCRHHTGIHYWADYYLLEILDPTTLEPVPEGEVGEMVVTTLRKEGSPLLRYRTRDLTRALPGRCPCGSVFPRHDRILGRSDDMFIFRAVNIYPSQIDAVLSQMPGVSSEFDVRLAREGALDRMRIRVERDPEREAAGDRELEAEIQRRLKSQLLVTPDVKIVDYGELPRSERKSKRVYDNR